MAALSGMVRLQQTSSTGAPDMTQKDAARPVAPTEPGHTSRLETVGRLASGVAHDFANILTLISGYTQILLERTGQAGQNRAELEEIRRASNRGAALISQLLSFARAHTAEPKPLAVNSVITEIERMLRPIIGETIGVTLRLDPAVGRVLADPVELDQVIMNLLLNARDAMPKGGSIVIETQRTELDSAAAAALNVTPGPCVMLRFSDTGEGIAPENMARLFDPFFTTKEMGKGAGLGLHTVRQIVQSCGGAVWATSDAGKGAIFHVCLPLQCPPTLRAAADGGEQTSSSRTAPRGSAEIVLVVEDEESVRRLLTQVLRLRGYRVLEASDGEEALEILQNRGLDVQLVLTDVIMPRIGGAELARHLKIMRPEVQLIFMSGYPDDQISRTAGLPAGRRFLRKPITPDVLSRAVREALDSQTLPFNQQ